MTDGGYPSLGEAAESETVEPPGSVEIVIDAIDTYYYAASHRSIVRRLTIRNIDVPEVGEDIVVTVTVESPLGSPPLQPFAIAIPPFPARDERVISNVRMAANHRALSLLDEQVSGDIVAIATVGGVQVGSARSPITFLAFNQWMHRPEYFDSLAAFVQPSGDAVRAVLAGARSLLGERTGSDSTEGYQSEGRGSDRLGAIAGAIFDSLCRLDLTYTDPPASFEGYGQKVRTPEVVMAERAATCLDSAVLYASCLEATGIDAYLVLVDGHAFAAYGTRRIVDETVEETASRVFQRSVADNANDIALLVSGGALVPVETTAFTAKRLTATFASAVAANAHYFTTDTQEVRALVNVAYARGHGVPAMLTRAATEEHTDEPTLETTAWAPEFLAETVDLGDGPPDDAGEGSGVDAAPPRVRAWLRSLLDLSFGNPLLRLGGSSGTLRVHRFELPAGQLGALEDRIMSAGFIDVLPATRAPAALLRDPGDGAALAAELTDSGRLFTPALSTLESDLSGLSATLTEQDPDLPPAERSRIAAESLHSHYAAALERSFAGLRRRAREIEDQTGANTLFLTIGTLVWAESGTGRRSGNDQGRAPLFLIPIRITGKASTGFRISAGDAGDVVPNYCLLEKLRQSYGIVINELERPINDESGIDVDHMIAQVRAALGRANVRDAVVLEDAHIAVLNFSTFRLWKDMRDHWQSFLESPVVAHLVERPNETFENPEPEATTPMAALQTPIEADQSQLQAIAWAVDGRSFVLEGPPGTGKSQTIANLLAASIAAGKKVLFVAEKQAALGVVKKRLSAVGLAAFCLDLHDKGSKPDQIREQIKASLDFSPLDREKEWDDVTARWGADRAALSAYRDALHANGRSGYTLWTAHQEELRLGDGARFDLPASLAEAAADVVSEIRDGLLELPRVAGPGPIATHAWSLAERTLFEGIDRTDLARLVGQLDEAFESVRTEGPGLGQALTSTREPSELEAAAIAVELWQAGDLPSAEELARLAAPGATQARVSTLARLDAFLEAQAPTLAQFKPDVYRVDLAPIVAAGAEAVTAGLFSRGKKRRVFETIVAPFLTEQADEVPAGLVALLQATQTAAPDLQRLNEDLARLPGVLLPPNWSPFDPAQVSELRRRLETQAASVVCLLAPAGAAARESLRAGWAPRPSTAQALRRTRELWAQLLPLLGANDASLARWRGERSFADAWMEEQPAWRVEAPRFLQLQRWCDLVATLDPLARAGLGDVRERILRGDVATDSAYEAFRRGLVTMAARERAEVGRLDIFDGHSHGRRVEDFTSRDSERRRLSRDRIPAELVGRRPMRDGRRIGKWGQLEQELERRRKRLSVRRLIEKYGDILPDLTPCFMMSPDSVARFVPPGSVEFDLVVFDEASQIDVAKAIGAMGRGRAVVIVGDTRQMPPSKFGGAAMGDDPDAFAQGDDETLYEDLESILEECAQSNLPRLYLECHYRSRHESLIAFSNHNFYDDRLTTFPSPGGSGLAAIGWRRVEGQFDRERGSEFLRTNRVEAEAIVAEIVARTSDSARSHQSICVVTFNAPQQSLIQRLLEESGDERIKELAEDDGDGGLIVRNLESVQGDERDVIMLSVAFSPQPPSSDGQTRRGVLPLNFGPLNKSGGERRLNVAVTRAREEVVVFCSFDPEEMKLRENAALGLQLLQTYLAAARDGVERSADLSGRAPSAPDLHRAEIAAALRARGLDVCENVGLSRFRVDLAVRHPGQDAWRVAILLDGPGWGDRLTVYDRDVLPTSVLRGAMGWGRVERIWLPMWLTARDEVLDDIERALAEAETPAPDVPEPAAADSMVWVDSVLDQPAHAGVVPPRSSVVDQLPPTDVRSGLPSTVDATVAVLPTAIATIGTVESEPLVAVAALPPLGGQDVLDRLRESAARALVTQAIEDALAVDAPLEAGLLARQVGARFGYGRLRKERVAAILRLVPPELRRKSNVFGEFVWRADLKPGEWADFRPSRSDTDRRPLDLIAPEEIGNAMVDLVHQGLEVEQDELVRATAETFGTRRLTAGARDRLERVVDLECVDAGRLQRAGTVVRVR